MTLIATCHCGKTRIALPEAPTHATECNCTYCSKSGGLWAYYDPDSVTVTENEGADYAPSGYNHHHFCTTCGCTTYGLSPAWSLGDTEVPKTMKFAVNARLLDDFDIGALVVEKIDGRNLW